MFSMDSNNQIKLGILMSYFSIAINIISGLLYTPWMISSIGKENYGLYTLAYSVIAFLVFDFGLSAAVTRYVAKYLAENRQDKVNDCIGLVYKLYLSIDIVIFIILARRSALRRGHSLRKAFSGEGRWRPSSPLRQYQWLFQAGDPYRQKDRRYRECALPLRRSRPSSFRRISEPRAR